MSVGDFVGHGRYELLKRLGQGGMSEVWMAHDHRLQEDVALKFLTPELVDDPAALSAMRRETLRSRKLSHPNILRIHDFFEEGGEVPFIAMELVRGSNLADLRRQQPEGFFSWDDIWTWADQLCQALEYAHEQGILHRDLKPENILVNEAGIVKLADFGVAAIAAQTENLPKRNLTWGTLPYSSPGQIRNEPPSHHDDIYALGATLYELLSSQPPFTDHKIGRQVEPILPPSPSNRLWALSLESTIPPGIDDVILRCLAWDPKARPQSAQDLRILFGFEEGVVSEPVTDEDDQSENSGSSQAKILLAIAAVAIIALIAAVFLPSRNTPEPAENLAVVEASLSPNRPGSLDPAFNPGQGVNGPIYDLQEGPDGKLYIAGKFTTYDGQPRKALARLQRDGHLDETLDIGVGPQGRFDYLHAVIPLEEGRCLVSGTFDDFANARRLRFAYLNPDGSLNDRKIDSRVGFPMFTHARTRDGRIVVGGTGSMRRMPNYGVSRISPEGFVDPSFQPGQGVPNISGESVYALAVQEDQKTLVGGGFKNFSGSPLKYLVRLNYDGTPDPTFNRSAIPNGTVTALAVRPDGGILIAGEFDKLGTLQVGKFGLLLPDGTVNQLFSSQSTFDGRIMSMVLLENGKILVGGDFLTCNGLKRTRLARLNADGSLDESFDPGEGANEIIRTMHQFSPDRVIIAGDFTTYDGAALHRIAMIRCGELE